jgi:hypothetical protein
MSPEGHGRTVDSGSTATRKAPMHPITHQTIKLSRGKHHSPDEGACVMELASMLAGEEFSDHPASVCPVIGALLRAHNDSIDDERRPDLFAYAARVVDSRSPGTVQDARVARLTEWDKQVRQRQSTPSDLPLPVRALNRILRVLFVDSHAHAFYRLTVHNDKTHAEVLALVDELLEIKPGRTGSPAGASALGPLDRLPAPDRR